MIRVQRTAAMVRRFVETAISLDLSGLTSLLLPVVDLPAESTIDGVQIANTVDVGSPLAGAVTAGPCLGALRPTLEGGTSALMSAFGALRSVPVGVGGTFVPTVIGGRLAMRITGGGNGPVNAPTLYQVASLTLRADMGGGVEYAERLTLTTNGSAWRVWILATSPDSSPLTGVSDTPLASVTTQIAGFYCDPFSLPDDTVYFATNGATGVDAKTDTGLSWAADCQGRTLVWRWRPSLTSIAWSVEDEDGAVLASGVHAEQLPNATTLGLSPFMVHQGAGTIAGAADWYGVDVLVAT